MSFVFQRKATLFRKSSIAIGAGGNWEAGDERSLKLNYVTVTNLVICETLSKAEGSQLFSTKSEL